MKFDYIDKCYPEGYKGWSKLLHAIGQEIYRILENNPNVQLSPEAVNSMVNNRKKIT